MIDLNVPVAFFAGLVSFFAPCVIPLLPAYIGYVTGVSVQDLKKHGYGPYRKKIITTSLLYILGFSLVFVLLGVSAASIGVFFRRYDDIIQRVGGLVILILGLEFAGFLHIPILARTSQFKLPSWTSKLGDLRAFFVGLIFAVAWTPCVGAILGSILTLAATASNVTQGAWLLFVYSMGISVPFLIVSLSLASAPKYLKVLTKKVDLIAKVSGIILAILGILLLTDTYRFVNQWVFTFADSIGWTQYLVNNL